MSHKQAPLDHLRLAKFALAASILASLALFAVSCQRSDPAAETGTTIDVSANPASIVLAGKTEGETTITARLTSDKGVPQSGVGVHFTTDSGRLSSGGSSAKTDGNGIARDTLTASTDATVTAKSGTITGSVDITVGGSNRPPVAAMSVTPSPQRPSGNVTFNGAGSTDPDGNSTISKWIWTLTSDIQAPSASTLPQCAGTAVKVCTFTDVSSFVDSFPESQNIVVQLQVEDRAGAKSTNAASANLVIMSNLPPVAEAGADAVTTRNTAVAFNASLSQDTNPGGFIVRYDWNFGDGSTLFNQSTPTVSHSYSVANTSGYTVTLTVWDNGGGGGACDPSLTPPCTGSLTSTDTLKVIVNP